SKWLPSLRRSAGARLTVMRLGGRPSPMAVNAARTRSRLSPTALSASPTSAKAPIPPGAICTWTSTSSTSTPWKATDLTRATIGFAPRPASRPPSATDHRACRRSRLPASHGGLPPFWRSAADAGAMERLLHDLPIRVLSGDLPVPKRVEVATPHFDPGSVLPGPGQRPLRDASVRVVIDEVMLAPIVAIGQPFK